ncbi:MAG: hypothetical protein WA001_02835 [Patescibacteria group bacterium]
MTEQPLKLAIAGLSIGDVDHEAAFGIAFQETFAKTFDHRIMPALFLLEPTRVIQRTIEGACVRIVDVVILTIGVKTHNYSSCKIACVVRMYCHPSSFMKFLS